MSADPVTRTYDVVVKLNSPQDLNTYTGMTASVKVEFLNEEHENSVLVPIEAIFPHQDKSFAWVIPTEGGTPEKREISMGAPAGEFIQILSGLSEGEQVAIAGLHVLSPQLQVRPSKPNQEGLGQ